jgi:1-phosphatidylinositol phosphodiesterase
MGRHRIPSVWAIPEKLALSTRILFGPSGDRSFPPLPLTFLSATNTPWAPPQRVALGWPGEQGINKRVGKWVLERLGDDAEGREREKRVRGWAMMDFCDAEVVRILVECNFRWRKHGDEGWV